MHRRVIAVVLLAATHAAAEPRNRALELRWQAPESCPTEAEVIKKVERQLGRPLDSAPSAVAANAVVSRATDGHFQVQLQTVVRGQARDRALGGSSCEALGDAVALVLAFLIDPDTAAAHAAGAVEAPTRAGSTESTAGAPVAPSEAIAPVQVIAPVASSTSLAQPESRRTSLPKTPLTPSAMPPATSESAPSRRPPWLARALVGVDSGVLPSATSFGGIALGRALGALSLEVSGLGFAPRERVISSTPVSRGGKFQLWELGAAAGYRLLSRSVELAPFLGVESGTVHGSGFGVAQPKQARGLWLAATATLRARYRLLPWLGVAADVGAALPLTRPEYELDNVGTVYQSNFITFRGATGLEAYF